MSTLPKIGKAPPKAEPEIPDFDFTPGRKLILWVSPAG